MNYLNSLFNQGRELFFSLTPQARLMAGLMVAVVVVSSGFLFRGSQTTAKVRIFDGHVFSDEELHSAQIALSEAKLSDWEVQGNQILVPKATRDVYIKAIGEAKAFPLSPGSSTDQALNAGTMFDGNLKNQARLMHARQKDVGRTLQNMQGIEKAWVNYDERREGFAREMKQSAVIFAKARGNVALSETIKRSMINAVKRSFAGLEPDEISLIDLGVGTSMDGEDDPLQQEGSKYLTAKQSYEQDLRKKAMNLLSSYSMEDGDVKVEVYADLEPTLREARETIKHDKPTAIQTQSSTKSVESSKAGSGGRPGAEPNVGLNQRASLASGESSSKTKEVTEGQKSVTGTERTLVETPGLILKNATLAVSIPKSYLQKHYVRRWKDLNPEAKPEDKPPQITEAALTDLQNEVSRSIEGQLAALLPPAPPLDKGANKYERVVVDFYVDSPLPELPKASLAETGLVWLSNSWQTLALVGVAIFAILVLRSAVSAQPRTRDEEFARGFGVQIDETMVGNDLTAMMEEEEGVESESSEESGNADSPARRFTMTGEKVREELAQIVRDNPSAAVNIIRNWIGDAA
ncbi:MAG: hypothetical protein U0905_09905 [Pirellulales bacterium]